jgi:hypothetical protein
LTTQVPTEQISDEYMHTRLAKTKAYTLVVVKPTAEYDSDRVGPIVWEHVRRNMALQASGVMPIVCPVGDGQISGIGIFDTDPDETAAIMADDPGVQAGIFTFEVHPCAGFPGDALPS